MRNAHELSHERLQTTNMDLLTNIVVAVGGADEPPREYPSVFLVPSDCDEERCSTSTITKFLPLAQEKA
jgi:hypothetical protein